MNTSIIAPFLALHNQIRIWHWLTDSYSQHKAFGEAYNTLSEQIDTFIETYAGRYTKAKLTCNNLTVQNTFYCSSGNQNAVQEIDAFMSEFLYGSLLHYIQETDTDLLNIRDEMVGGLNKLKYLLSLN
jgi:hypothetical protein